MPPKKSKGKAKKNASSVSGSVVHRSIKHNESSLDYDYNPAVPTPKVEDEPKDTTENKKEVPSAGSQEGNISDGVFGYYMSLVDVSITTKHVFQFFLLLFLTNLIYFVFKMKQEELDVESGKKLMETLITVGCILLTTLLESFAVLNSRFRQFEKSITTEKPQLLDFNYIYTVFFPLAIGVLKVPHKIVIISACVVQLGYLNLFVRCLISYVILFQFSPDLNLLSINELVLPFITCFFYEMMDRFVGSEIKIYEKSFLSIILTIGSIFVKAGDDTNVTLYIMKGLYLSFIIGMILAAPLLELYKSQKEKTLKFTWLFGIYLLFISAGLIISDKLLLPKLNKFHLNWLIDYIKESEERTGIFQNWIISSIVLIPGIFVLFNKIDISLSLKRKVWHFIIFVLLINPFMQQCELVSIALFGILGILIIVEVIRYNELPPFGKSIKKLFVKFQDSKDDEEGIILSYIYLVLGISLPIWTNNVDKLRESSYIGLITLGLGDSLASIIGGKFGSNHWPNSKKTIEGSFAMMVGMLIGYLTIDYIGNYNGVMIDSLRWNNRITCAVLCAFFEGIVDANDNLFLPVFGYLVEELLGEFN